MIRDFCICGCLILSTAIPVRAANVPHAGTDSQLTKVWTNDGLAKLHHAGVISIVGQAGDEQSVPESAPEGDEVTQKPHWYAEQAVRLRHELEYRETQLREYLEALEDARSLRETVGGIDLAGEHVAITPEAGIQILQERLTEARVRLDALDNLARRNDIESGTLRGR
jgi:hypothetical protein